MRDTRLNEGNLKQNVSHFLEKKMNFFNFSLFGTLKPTVFDRDRHYL